MDNAVLTIHDSEGFSDDIWQLKSDFDENQWKSIINDFANLVQDVYDFLDSELYDEEGNNVSYPADKWYQLGDLANMLNSIGVKKAVIK